MPCPGDADLGDGVSCPDSNGEDGGDGIMSSNSVYQYSHIRKSIDNDNIHVY